MILSKKKKKFLNKKKYVFFSVTDFAEKKVNCHFLCLIDYEHVNTFLNLWRLLYCVKK